jgi:hypothetical protein
VHIHRDGGQPTSAYVPLAAPTRLLDTRLTTGALPSGGLASVAVTGTAPLPAPGAVLAAVLNVTVVGPAGVGFWTVFPHDGDSYESLLAKADSRMYHDKVARKSHRRDGHTASSATASTDAQAKAG